MESVTVYQVRGCLAAEVRGPDPDKTWSCPDPLLTRYLLFFCLAAAPFFLLQYGASMGMGPHGASTGPHGANLGPSGAGMGPHGAACRMVHGIV
jgi:hypothetical protein